MLGQAQLPRSQAHLLPGLWYSLMCVKLMSELDLLSVCMCMVKLTSCNLTFLWLGLIKRL